MSPTHSCGSSIGLGDKGSKSSPKSPESNSRAGTRNLSYPELMDQHSQWSVGCYTVVVDAYVLDLGGVDLILGITWLENVGLTTIDWQKKIVSFKDYGQLITL